jgi:hypothetical protein
MGRVLIVCLDKGCSVYSSLESFHDLGNDGVAGNFGQVSRLESFNRFRFMVMAFSEGVKNTSLEM